MVLSRLTVAVLLTLLKIRRMKGSKAKKTKRLLK